MNTEHNVIVCCGRKIWTEFVREHDNGELETYLILPGDLVAVEFHGACLLCGKEWHWSPPEVRLRRIMARRETWTTGRS